MLRWSSPRATARRLATVVRGLLARTLPLVRLCLLKPARLTAALPRLPATHPQPLPPCRVALPYEKGLFVVVRAVQLLREHMSGLLVVTVGGPSGSGKTSFCRRLAELLAGCSILSLSDYIDTAMSELTDGNVDDPRATDFHLLLRNLSELRAGHVTRCPVYDFKGRTRSGWREVAPPANGVLVVEGVYALNAVVRTMSDLCVSISGGVHYDLVKRIKRDCIISQAGEANKADEVAGGQLLQNISETVFPFFKAFVEPDLQLAHVRVTNSHNPFSGFLDQATYSLKSDKAVDAVDVETYMEAFGKQRRRARMPRFDSVTSNSSVDDDHTVGRMDMDDGGTHGDNGDESSGDSKPYFTFKTEETTDIYLLPPGMEAETCKDWIRMRLRDGHYSVHFEEYVTDGNLIISPGMSFEVNVRVLSGLMTLGYTVGAILKRSSDVFESTESDLLIKLDHVEKLNKTYVSINSKERTVVEATGTALVLDGHYMARSYIEHLQLMDLFADVEADLGSLQLGGSGDGHGPFLPTSPPSSPFNSPLKHLANKLSPMAKDKQPKDANCVGDSSGVRATDESEMDASDRPGRSPARRSLDAAMADGAVAGALAADGAGTTRPLKEVVKAAPPPPLPTLNLTAVVAGGASQAPMTSPGHLNRVPSAAALAARAGPSGAAATSLGTAVARLGEIADAQRAMSHDMGNLAAALEAMERRTATVEATRERRSVMEMMRYGAVVAAAAAVVAAATR